MSATLEDALDRLPRPARERLARFAAEFEMLDAREYTLFGTVPEDIEALERAMAAADAALGLGSRREAVRAAVSAFVDAASIGYSNRLALPDTLLLFQSLADRAEDRVRLIASLERAVVALALWDELDSADLGALIGPWAEVTERALPQDDAERA
ncbi:MAG: hypothetical protein L0221_11495 [Chloroflexi bacterium]|nr:hypothetical protein [Chloroflexota bacterium]